MVAPQWLEEAVATADHCHVLREQPEQPDSPQNDSIEEESSSESVDNSSCSEMSSSDKPYGPITLEDYGPTNAEHKTHVNSQLSHLGSQSTKKQYDRKLEEYKEFANVVFHDDEITVERALKFLQFQAHREMRVNNESPDEAVERAATGKRKRKSKRMKKSN